MKGAIFDMDGTILDSMHTWDNIGDNYLRSRGVMPPSGLHSRLKTMGVEQVAGYFRQAFGIQEELDSIVNQINHMVEEAYLSRIQLKPGSESYLRCLRDGGVQLCLLTATNRYLAEGALRRLGVWGYFSHVLTCPELGVSKESCAVYRRALGALGTPPEETVVFEDALYAIGSAKKAGFRVVGVSDASSVSDEKEIRRLADYFVYNLTECRGVVE